MMAPAAPQLLEIPLAELHESPLNPRRHYDKDALEDLSASIQAKGVLNPGLVRPRSAGGYEFAAGHRRYRACKLAKRATMPCLIRPMDEEEFLTVLVVENEQREDVHPLDQATGYQRLLELPGYDVAAVAAKVGKSESFIYQRLQLLQLTPAAQKLFLGNRMTAGHAVILARLQPKDQAEALASWLFHGGGPPRSSGDLRSWVQRNVLCPLGGAGFPLDDAMLVPPAGPCTTCPKRTGHQRELLPALDDGGGTKGTDRCLDPACFAGKIAAHLGRRRAELEQKHGPLAPITLDYNYGTPAKKGQPLNRSQWWPAKAGDPEARAALVVAGDGIGQLKHITTIRPKEPARADPLAAKSRHEAVKRKQEKVRRRRIFDALRQKLPGSLAQADAVALITGYLHEMQQESVKDVCRIHGIEPAKRARGEYGIDWIKPVTAYAATLSNAEATRLLRSLPLIADLDRTWFTASRADALMTEAKRLNVNIKAIDASLTKEAAATMKGKNAKPKKKLAGEVRRAMAKKKAKATTASGRSADGEGDDDE